MLFISWNESTCFRNRRRNLHSTKSSRLFFSPLHECIRNSFLALIRAFCCLRMRNALWIENTRVIESCFETKVVSAIGVNESSHLSARSSRTFIDCDGRNVGRNRTDAHRSRIKTRWTRSPMGLLSWIDWFLFLFFFGIAWKCRMNWPSFAAEQPNFENSPPLKAKPLWFLAQQHFVNAFQLERQSGRNCGQVQCCESDVDWDEKFNFIGRKFSKQIVYVPKAANGTKHLVIGSTASQIRFMAKRCLSKTNNHRNDRGLMYRCLASNYRGREKIERATTSSPR